MDLPRVTAAARLALAATACGVVWSCSTGDPDPMPADAGRIERTTTRVDSALQPARDHIRAIDSLGGTPE